MEESIKEKVGKRVTIIGLVGNIILSGIKFVLGFISMSSALIADAVHSLSDLVTDFVCYFSLKYAEQPEDEDHPYGHSRIESFGTAVIGIILIIVGVGMIYVIAENLITGEIIIPTTVAIYGAVISIVMKEVMFQYTKYQGLKIKSKILVANAWHHRSDAISSIAALIGICGSIMGYPLLDPIAALVVAAIIIKVGGEITYDAYINLIDTSVPSEVKKKIVSVITKTDGVRAFHDLKSRVVADQIWLEVHVVVQPRISITEGHTIAELVRSRIMEQVEGVQEVVVHCDAEDDQDRIFYDFNRKKIDKLIKEIIEGSNINGSSYRSTIHYLNNVQDLELKISLADVESFSRLEEACHKIKAQIEKEELFNKVSIYVEVK